MPPAPATDLAVDLTNHLSSRGLPPAPHWLHATLLPSLLNSSRPAAAPPLVATRQTAVFRLLATDIAAQPSCLAHSAAPLTNRLPPDIAPAAGAVAAEALLRGPVAVQVLDVEDVGRSRWSQVEALEARVRGEGTKGREVIRLADGGEDDIDGGAARRTAAPGGGTGAAGGPHKLLLVDAAGTRVYGFELAPVPGVGVERMSIGAKLVLRNAVVARGVVLLEPRTTTCLGGKVEALDKPWRESRLARLREAARMDER